MATAAQKITCRRRATSLQQAGPQPVQRPARQGRRLARGTGRDPSPGAASSSRCMSGRCWTTADASRPACSKCRRRPPLSRARTADEAEAPRPHYACALRCRDAASGILIDEVSLVENIERAPLHPLDQFRAFQALRDKGMTEEAIAAAFFIGVNVVKQRLRLAAVRPSLLDGLRRRRHDPRTADGLHRLGRPRPPGAGLGRDPDSLAEGTLADPADAHRNHRPGLRQACAFVGLETYEAAGGIVLRDLFQSDDGGWLQDAGLSARPGLLPKLRVEADRFPRRDGSGSMQASASPTASRTQCVRS